MAGGPEMFLGNNLTTEGAAASAARGGGMNLMPGLALGGYLLGTGLDLYGQHQGAKSMEKAAQQQLAEKIAFMQERNALAEAELARRTASPAGLSQSAGATARLGGTLRSVNASAKAGGKALGVNAAGVNTARTNLLPQLQLAAHRGAASDRSARDQRYMTRLGMDMGDVSRRADEAAYTYGAEDDLAGMSGQSARLAGGLLRLGGQSGINYLMQQERPGLRG